MRRAAVICAALLALLAPAVAAACPYCAGRSDGGVGRWAILGSFVMFPFLVAVVVMRVVRSGERDELLREGAGHADGRPMLSNPRTD